MMHDFESHLSVGSRLELFGCYTIQAANTARFLIRVIRLHELDDWRFAPCRYSHSRSKDVVDDDANPIAVLAPGGALRAAVTPSGRGQGASKPSKAQDGEGGAALKALGMAGRNV